MGYAEKIQDMRSQKVGDLYSLLKVCTAKQGLTVHSDLRIKGFTLTGMLKIFAKLPGIFIFDLKQAGKPVPTKSYSVEGKDNYEVYHEVTPEEEKSLIKSGNYSIIKISMTHGQLGPTDFKCFCLLEKVLYEEIISNRARYTNCTKDQIICIGTQNKFVKNSIGYSGNKSYLYVENFLIRLSGLHIDFCGKAKAVGIAAGNFHPFGFVAKGSQKDDRKLYIKVHPAYVNNIINNHIKPLYYELIRKIEQPSSKHLFRYLSMKDYHPFIAVKYSELVKLFSLVRHTRPSAIREQIGNIARHCNNESIGTSLLYVSMDDNAISGKNFPFLMKPAKDDKRDYVFVFALNAFTTPDMHDYNTRTIALQQLKNDELEERELYQKIQRFAVDCEMTVEDFLNSHYAALVLSRVQIVAAHEKEIKQKQLKASLIKERTLGKLVMKKHSDKSYHEVKQYLENDIEEKQSKQRSSKLANKEKTLQQQPKRRGRPKRIDS